MTRPARAPLLRFAVPVALAGVLALPALAVSQSPAPGPRGPNPDHIFNTLDTNGDGVIDTAERKAAQLRRFDAMDANKDGRLTKDEIELAFARPGRPGDMPGAMPPEGGPPPGVPGMGRPGGPPPGGPVMGRPDRAAAAARYAARIGADKPGGVSRAEFAERDMPMLVRIDLDRDGQITRVEFDQFVARMKDRMKPPGSGAAIQPPPAR